MKKIKLKPYCQCVQLYSGTMTTYGRETTTKDGIKCDKCEHFVAWKNPESVGKRNIIKPNAKKVKKDMDNFFLEEYSIGL